MVPGKPADPLDERRARVRERRRALSRSLHAHERDWRFAPGDGGSPETVSATALERELELDRELASWAESSPKPRSDAELAAERRRLKYFPVLFVSAPHIESGASGSFPGIPTPLLYATSVLDRALRIDEFPGARVPEVVAVMNPLVYDSAFEEQLTALLRAHRPRLVGVSNLSEGHHFALRIARLIKRVSPESLVLLGGQHEDGVNPEVYVSASERLARRGARYQAAYSPFLITPEEADRLRTLQTLASQEERAFVDLVFAGDAAYALLEILKVVADHLTADTARIKAEILARPEVFAGLPGSGRLFLVDEGTETLESVRLSGSALEGDSMPFIDLGRLTHENRFPIFGGKLTAQVLACHGCKYSCSFCHESADSTLYGTPKIRQRSAGNVVKEIELRLEQGFEAVFFDDSTFTQDRRWVAEFAGLMARRGGGRPLIEWGCQTTINDVDAALLRQLSEIGCSYVYFGVESAEPDPASVQKVRQLRVLPAATNWSARFREVAKWCHEAGVRVGTSLQFGLGETREQLIETVELIAEMHRCGYIPDGCVALNINSPYPATRQWLELLKSGRPMPDYREKLKRHPSFETAHQFSSISGAEAEELYRLAAERLGAAIHVEGR
ncbi:MULTISPECIES: B12-binding domain-containing radical SAM protein [Amycolatopsis]|uniref:B12-binding domain-containing radical SAM protein n=1 Tax=Amycolatopsis albidoflavus TaxID=102226 RepID=A0ABW5HX45_9PSEU